MLRNVTETRGYEPIGSKLPSHLSPSLRALYISAVTGNFVPLSLRERGSLVNNYFPKDPLVPVSEHREGALRKDLRNLFGARYFQNRFLQQLSGDVVFFQKATDLPNLPSMRFRPLSEQPIFVVGNLAHELQDTYPVLTPTQKEDLMTDPHIWTSACLFTADEGFTRNTISNETRLFFPGERNPNYAITQEYLRQLIEKTRSAQERQEGIFSVLDIGGSNGWAAHELEGFDPSIEVTNFVLDPEPGVWPLRGSHVLGLAEVLPKEYEETFDLIFSNYAFMHMRYPHAAFVNAIAALKVGGVLNVNFGITADEDEPQHLEVIASEAPALFDWLKGLHEKGVIDFLPDHTLDSIPDLRKRSNRFKDGRISLAKNHSLRNTAFPPFI